jgi:hypothetical protein
LPRHQGSFASVAVALLKAAVSSLMNYAALMQAHEEIAELTSAFYSAFTNCGGPPPVDGLYDICLPEALIVNTTSQIPAVYNLRAFIEPRRTLLESGALKEFSESEVSAETAVHGRIAHRVSRYEKSWIERGVQMQGGGTKMLSFVRTPEGWKLASVLWHDDDQAQR